MDAQKKFLKEHIGKWVPIFISLFKKKTERGFYKELIKLAEIFISFELNYLNVKPEQLTNPVVTLKTFEEDFSLPCEGSNSKGCSV